MHIIDEITLKRAVNGNAHAMEDVIAACLRPVYHICLRVLGNVQDAEDAAQDAVMKVYRSLSSFRGDSEFSSWLYRIATNAALDFMRRRGTDTVPMDEAVAEQVQDTAKGPSELYGDAELAAAVNACIMELDPIHRQVLLLREHGGMSYQEIADKLQVETGTVKSRIARAREALRAKFMEKQLL